MDKKIVIKKKDNVIFGITFSAVFLIIALWPLLDGLNLRTWSLITSAAFVMISLTFPNVFTYLNLWWIKLGYFLGKIISPIVMGIVFFIIVTPIGLLLRLFGKDILRLKRNKNSYWINRDYKIQSMKKQF
ncbi:MAG: SxtJ family membrane protein [Candidatus Fonsibacter sp.]|jgi:predicted membrane metal-binding protein